jgi:hypothetical protein
MMPADTISGRGSSDSFGTPRWVSAVLQTMSGTPAACASRPSSAIWGGRAPMWLIACTPRP